ncbi:hypothetical protein AAMO2058_000326400 [Amorphochlora amoebiformis]
MSVGAPLGVGALGPGIRHNLQIFRTFDGASGFPLKPGKWKGGWGQWEGRRSTLSFQTVHSSFYSDEYDSWDKIIKGDDPEGTAAAEERAKRAQERIKKRQRLKRLTERTVVPFMILVGCVNAFSSVNRDSGFLLDAIDPRISPLPPTQSLSPPTALPGSGGGGGGGGGAGGGLGGGEGRGFEVGPDGVDPLALLAEKRKEEEDERKRKEEIAQREREKELDKMRARKIMVASVTLVAGWAVTSWGLRALEVNGFSMFGNERVPINLRPRRSPEKKGDKNKKKNSKTPTNLAQARYDPQPKPYTRPPPAFRFPDSTSTSKPKPSSSKYTSDFRFPQASTSTSTSTGARATSTGTRPTSTGKRPTSTGTRPTSTGTRPTSTGTRPTSTGGFGSVEGRREGLGYEAIADGGDEKLTRKERREAQRKTKKAQQKAYKKKSQMIRETATSSVKTSIGNNQKETGGKRKSKRSKKKNRA